MKRKLTRATIDEVRKEMLVLSLNEEKGVIGGGNLYIIDAQGKITYSSSMSSEQNQIVIGSIDSGNIFYFSGDVSFVSVANGYRISGSGVSKRMFEFLANNTDVEWAMYKNSNSGYGFIETNIVL